MPDNRTIKGAGDRARVAADEGYEVQVFAAKHRLTTAQAERLIRQYGNDRTRLDAAAEKLNRCG